ncbi:TetR/AcrR family transcriptional regulator [Antrihabitans cavernicola]|uniref:TetR/AcrR family transcriptional regulator n=1 Tax=Antrihabitans cavernicola TaxID=2495913 RepID=A0A5A7SEA9_9NOCA|nr:TetR/AcrR family transcriptional regulator [Spelaeibacter cavernicola]KAA0023542.1 TetR/AcrR family transcriptional regulator [Spelaeibacter cavernicola]
MSEPDFIRARRPEQKQRRREVILEAARVLAADSGVRNVSLSNVAGAAGLAKSNVVRYFGSREEIYLVLAGAGWTEWTDAVADRLTDDMNQDAVVYALAYTLLERPQFCDLLGHTTTNLEHNISVAAARAYKITVYSTIIGLSTKISRSYPLLSVSESIELVAAATGFAAMYYPVSNPPPPLVELYRREPGLGALCPDFLSAVSRALTVMATGLPAARPLG